MEHTSLLLHDPTIWVFFSFAVFVVLAFLFGRRSVLSILDAKIEKIRTDITSAERLRNEAESLLLQYKGDLENASIEADRILAKAKLQADDIRKQAETDFADTMQRREAMLKTRIEQMERTAVDDIRRYAAELAISATSEIIAQKLSPEAATTLGDASIRQIGEKLN